MNPPLVIGSYIGSRPSSDITAMAMSGPVAAGTPEMNALSQPYVDATCRTLTPLLLSIEFSFARRRAMMPATMKR